MQNIPKATALGWPVNFGWTRNRPSGPPEKLAQGSKNDKQDASWSWNYAKTKCLYKNLHAMSQSISCLIFNRQSLRLFHKFKHADRHYCREQHPRSHHKSITSMQKHPVVRQGSNWWQTASTAIQFLSICQLGWTCHSTVISYSPRAKRPESLWNWN